MSYVAYVLVNPYGNTYTGQTCNLTRRIAEHNDPLFNGTLHTKRWPGPWRLLHSECFETRSEAMRRERDLKTGKGRAFIRDMLSRGC